MKWPDIRLEKIARVSGGSTPKRNNDDFWGGDIKWATPTDLPMPGHGIADIEDTADLITEKGLQSCSASLLPPGTVIFSTRATIGKIGIAKVPLTTNQGFANFTPKECTDSKYLAYSLQFYTPQITQLAGSTTFKEVSRGAIKRFKILLPTITEQRRIVEILDQADRLRKLRAEADKKAERILPALFINMFGDPATNPMGWPVYDFSEITEFVTDGTHQSPKFSGSGIPFLFVQNIVSGKIDFETKKFISHETYEILTKNRKPQRGDILYSTVGSYGVAVLVETDRLFSFQRHIGHIRCLEELVDPYFLCAQMNTPFIKMQADQRARGIAQKTVNLSEIKQFKAVIPSKEKQQKFISLAKDTLAKLDMQRQQADKLAELFNVLLHRAFAGDLTASWRQAHMKELLQEMELQAKALAS